MWELKNYQILKIKNTIKYLELIYQNILISFEKKMAIHKWKGNYHFSKSLITLNSELFLWHV